MTANILKHALGKQLFSICMSTFDNIKVNVRDVGWGGAWTGSIWLSIGTRG
jgi:hypothetical protein